LEDTLTCNPLPSLHTINLTKIIRGTQFITETETKENYEIRLAFPPNVYRTLQYKRVEKPQQIHSTTAEQNHSQPT
jgi:hypothetical protein